MTNILEFRPYIPQEAHTQEVKNYAFSLDYSPRLTDQEIGDDVISYLAEYRLKIPEYTYSLMYSLEDGEFRVRDSYRGESMITKTQKALEMRKSKFQSTHREEAEFAAFEQLDTALQNAQDGDTLIWGSPPGDPEEGYGDYGFVYHGRVNALKSGEKELAMTAVRVNKARIQEYNSFFSEVTGRQQDLSSAEDFIANPIIAGKSFEKFEIDNLLKNNFSGLEDVSRDDTRSILAQLRPAIKELIAHIRFSPSEVKRKALNAIENMAIELKRRIGENITTIPEQIQLLDIIDTYGHEPPVEKGSCGISGEVNSNDIFGMVFAEDEHGGRTFKCPSCDKVNIRPYGELLSSCQHCGSGRVAC